MWRATLSREAWIPIWGLSTESMKPWPPPGGGRGYGTKRRRWCGGTGVPGGHDTHRPFTNRKAAPGEGTVIRARGLGAPFRLVTLKVGDSSWLKVHQLGVSYRQRRERSTSSSQAPSLATRQRRRRCCGRLSTAQDHWRFSRRAPPPYGSVTGRLGRLCLHVIFFIFSVAIH